MQADGIHGMLPREQMTPGARKFRDYVDIKPGAPIYQKEFGFYSLEKWQREEGLDPKANLSELFGYDPPGVAQLGGLGWCEAGFVPEFETVVLEDRGDYELVQDFAGRSVLYFKGRRNGFMPEYVDHPVKDQKTWEEKCLWRMNPKSPERQAAMDAYLPRIVKSAQQGLFISQGIVGGYMYLRSLIGPADLLYMFYDAPEIIHACMRAWYELADDVIARHQQAVTIESVYIGEDICYNHGPLISPDMIREFLFPYYQQILTNVKRRNIDQARKLHFHVDTDGFCDPVIPVYRELGMTWMDPFEGASDCDVVRTGREYPDLVISGGFDKRIMAQGKDAIDREIDRILPIMRERGGYTPTCDHGVPEEVTLESYMHYRKRCLEFGS